MKKRKGIWEVNINYTSILQELYIDLKEDDLYVCEEDREEAFIYLGIRDIHRAARENIRLDESKQIVYDNDVLEIIKNGKIKVDEA